MGRKKYEEHVLDAIEGALNKTAKEGLEEKSSADSEVNSIKELSQLVELVRKVPVQETPADFTEGVMNRVRKINRPRWIRFWFFLMRPRQVRISVLGAMSGAAALAIAIAMLMNTLDRHQAGPPVAGTSQQEYMVQFTYRNPKAKEVYIAGSFNNWRKDELALVDASNRGVWVRTIPLKPGTYEYMFFVDGKWIMDELANRYKDDGFGRKNAVLNLSNDHERRI